MCWITYRIYERLIPPEEVFFTFRKRTCARGSRGRLKAVPGFLREAYGNGESPQVAIKCAGRTHGKSRILWDEVRGVFGTENGLQGLTLIGFAEACSVQR